MSLPSDLLQKPFRSAQLQVSIASQSSQVPAAEQTSVMYFRGRYLVWFLSVYTLLTFMEEVPHILFYMINITLDSKTSNSLIQPEIMECLTCTNF